MQNFLQHQEDFGPGFRCFIDTESSEKLEITQIAELIEDIRRDVHDWVQHESDFLKKRISLEKVDGQLGYFVSVDVYLLEVWIACKVVESQSHNLTADNANRVDVREEILGISRERFDRGVHAANCRDISRSFP